MAAIVAIALPAAVGAAEGDAGYRGPPSVGIANSAPTGAKPESKLWWNDGSWWGIMYDSAARDGYKIWRLDASSQSWINTGVRVDSRNQARADTLWDGTHLYVASHIFVDNTGANVIGQEARLYRYSYDDATDSYSLDAGFPVQISESRMEALVLEQDSTGALWATWVRGGQVWVNRTRGDDAIWGSPFVLPFPQAATLSLDDIASIVVLPGKVGIMWSHQIDDAFYWAEHTDGQPDDAWALETALAGPGLADDHINLKTDSTGRVYAAVKTSKTLASEPLVLLLVRDPAGTWASHVVGTVADHHTRPIVVVDEANGAVIVLATARESGGKIYKKTSPLDAISFPAGTGSVFIADGASADMNDATSSKRGVSPATGLAVLASNDSTDFYWHNWDSLVLDAEFTVSQAAGIAPLAVSFNDSSTGNPTAWSWNFGDGSPLSTEQNPTHTYEGAGSYTVTLTVSSPRGETSVETKGAYVVVTPSVVYMPTDDSWVRSTTPTSNFGTQPTLSVKSQASSGTFQQAYVRFAVTGMTQPVVAAKLRLYVKDPSPDGGAAYLTGSSWTERTITWSNAPPLIGDPLGAAGATESGTWAEIPLPASLFAAGDGVYSFAIANTSNDTAGYGSRQSATAPQLVLGIPG